MADQNDNQSPKALIKRGVGKIASKFGHTSQATAGYSSLGSAISTTFSGALSMTPSVSLAHKEEYYSLPDPSQGLHDANGARYRGRVDLRTHGKSNQPQYNRLPGGDPNLNKKGDDKSEKKDVDKGEKEDDDEKKKGENSKKDGEN